MSDAKRVQVRHTTDQLLEEPPSFTLLDLALVNDVIEELPTRCILKDQAQTVRCLYDLVICK